MLFGRSQTVFSYPCAMSGCDGAVVILPTRAVALPTASNAMALAYPCNRCDRLYVPEGERLVPAESWRGRDAYLAGQQMTDRLP